MSTKVKRLSLSQNDTLPADEFEPRNVNVRITTFIDGDTLLKLKRLGQRQKLGYQTILNQILRNAVSEQPEGSTKILLAEIKKIIREELRKVA